MVIKLVGRADLARLHQFMVGSQLDEPKEAIHALDVVLRQSPYLKLTHRAANLACQPLVSVSCTTEFFFFSVPAMYLRQDPSSHHCWGTHSRLEMVLSVGGAFIQVFVRPRWDFH